MKKLENNIKQITIADVAEALGVSKTTVSRAISGKGRIGEATRKRVQEYIAVNDYKPNVIAKGLAQQKTYNIAMILPADCNISELPFFQNCMFGVCEAASAREYDVLAVYTVGGKKKNLERILSNRKIDGVLLSRTMVKDEEAEFVKSKGIPVVAIGSSLDETLIQVDNDHRKACCDLTSRLIGQGLRKIGLIGGSNLHMVTRDRYRGFTDAFANADIPVEAELVFLDVESATPIDEMVEKLLKKGAECIVCMDDMICSRVLQKLQREHVRIPEQIRVASFYSSLLVESYVPAVTSLEFDVKELGMTACNTLIDLIEGKEVPEKTLLSYTVAIKETT